MAAMTRAAASVIMVAFVFLMSPTSAQSVDGRWTTPLHAPDGQLITITLKSDGSKLTGTLYGRQPIPLEGTIDGDKLKMTLKVAGANGGELLVNYIAVLEGDELKFTFQPDSHRLPVFGPKAREFSATRVK
jgi:hypothetical protein